MSSLLLVLAVARSRLKSIASEFRQGFGIQERYVSSASINRAKSSSHECCFPFIVPHRFQTFLHVYARIEDSILCPKSVGENTIVK
jgi:hypothetical protein